jgi:hypothetical protein
MATAHRLPLSYHHSHHSHHGYRCHHSLLEGCSSVIVAAVVSFFLSTDLSAFWRMRCRRVLTVKDLKPCSATFWDVSPPHSVPPHVIVSEKCFPVQNLKKNKELQVYFVSLSLDLLGVCVGVEWRVSQSRSGCFWLTEDTLAYYCTPEDLC